MPLHAMLRLYLAAALAASALAASAGALRSYAVEDGSDSCVELLQQGAHLHLRQRQGEGEDSPGSLRAATAAARRSGREAAAVYDLWPGAPPSADGLAADAGPEEYITADPRHDPIAIICDIMDYNPTYFFFNVTLPQLYAFPAERSRPNFKNATVLVVPGGGFHNLAWVKEGTDIAEWLNSIGYSAFVLKYRVPGRVARSVPEAVLADAQRALSMIRSKADVFGLDPSRVGMMGFSAGGAITGRVAGSRQRAYAPSDAVDAFPHRPNFAVYVYGTGEPLDALHSVPSFLACATDDVCVPQVRVDMFFQALLASKVSAEMHAYREGGHGYGRCSMYTHSGHWDPVCQWPMAAELWMSTTVMGMLPPSPIAE